MGELGRWAIVRRVIPYKGMGVVFIASLPLAGCPIKGENYFKAKITVGRVGFEQAAARREFD